MKLSVPYYSQFVDVEDSFWMLRACGATCFKMVAEFHLPVSDSLSSVKKKVPTIVELCNEAKERGGYHMQNGWVHDYIVMKAKELGLQAYRKEGSVELSDVIASLSAGNPVIVSVEKRVLEQTRFHMVVIVGYDLSQTTLTNTDHADQISVSTSLQSLIPKSYFYYHEPESTDKNRGIYRVCDVETFKQYWRGKAIFITK